MFRKILIAVFISVIFSGTAYSQAGSFAGAFARLGFGARGLAMGNAMVSNTFGDVPSYYNPALSSFQEEGLVNLGYTFLSLDRQLNFVGFSKKFRLPNQDKGGAGISLGWINSGVGDIDGRDNDTRQIGMFSTFDNQFFLGTSFILSEQVNLGLGFKLYYSKLFDDVTSSSIAFDFGGTFRPSPDLSFGFAVRDLKAKNTWNTSDIYGSLGNTTEDKFPTLINLGGTYRLPKGFGFISVEGEFQNNPTRENLTSTIDSGEVKNNLFLRIGGEIALSQQFKLRAGLDRIDFGSDDFGGGLKPSAGFGFSKAFGEKIMLGLDYSFQLEPYTHNPIQNVSVAFKFK